MAWKPDASDGKIACGEDEKQGLFWNRDVSPDFPDVLRFQERDKAGNLIWTYYRHRHRQNDRNNTPESTLQD